ncbi:hypothetical protein HMPREF3197_00264 [Klebsiella pneumoniae]|nr:hypothetical protein HMPREF3197_00264 [Klebsiella pneumoniae]
MSSISVAQISDLFLLTGRYSDYYTHRTTCDSRLYLATLRALRRYC